MSLKTRTALAGAVVVGVMSVAAASASAYTYTIGLPFKNWVVSGSVTPKKLNEPINLPAGSTFNGEAQVNLLTFSGPISGTIFVPPFNATMKILGVPETVGMKLTQVGSIEGQITRSTQETVDCPGAVEQNSICVTLSVPSRVNLAITVVGVLGINVPTTCETSEPIAFDAVDTLTLKEVYTSGPQFTGTATFPPVACYGVNGLVLGPVLTTLISGPDNPYVLSLKRPA